MKTQKNSVIFVNFLASIHTKSTKVCQVTRIEKKKYQVQGNELIIRRKLLN